MGDKNINLSASIKVGRKPKDGKDGTSVTILSTKVYYQVSASPTDIPASWVEDIKNAIQTDSKPYLWSKTIVAYSDNNKTVTFSVSYKGKDGTNGTSFTPKGMADGYYSKATEIPAYSDEQNGKIYIVDDATNVISPFIVPDAPYVAQYVLHNGEYVLYLVHAEFGDGYNVNGHLYVANDDKWVDFGEIQGAKGEQGDPGIDGKDAINIVFSPAELVFDANENGNLKQSEKSAEIKVYRGTTELNYKTDWDNDAEIGDNCRAALLVNTTTNKPEVKISGITSSMIDDVKVPATSGGAKVSVIIDKVTYRAYLPFSVNVNTYANFLIRDNKKYISKYTEVSNKYDAVSSELNKKADLKTVESTIEQTAENIKLEVLSKTSGRRNMLVNSAFRNQDSVLIHSLARIEKNTGVDGVNCIHSSDTYSGTGDGNYIGAFWDSTQKNGVVTNIPIVKGKKYVISCWIRSDNLDLPFVIECFFMNSINQQNRGEDAVRKEYHVDNVNEWKRIDFVVDTTDTSEYASKVTPYLAVNFWSNNKNVPKAIGADEYPTCNAYICKPMMEEGDTYGGWTLSDGDYDYVGGNMIDNARTLEVGGSLKSINENNVADYGLAYYGDSMSLRINNTNDSTPSIMTFTPSLEVGVDYIFSFLAKGTANIGLYALCDNSVDGDYLLSEDSVNADVRVVDTFRNRYASIILIPTQLTTEYKRYWGHMRFYGHVPTKLYLQLNHAGEVYISQPKLEIGAMMTEFTERKTDLVDKASLKKAGIEITTNQVKLYGDKVEVVTTTKNEDGTSTDTQTAMFSNGKLNANLIDADAINVNHVYARSSEGANIIGHFGNFDKADAVVGSDKCPLWLGAALAKDAPFRVTKDGSLYASKGIFAGELKSVIGSFHKLTAVSSDGKTNAGSIYFDSSGYITFDADIFNQGYNSAAKRGWRFYASTIWCRQAFGHRQSTLAVVIGNIMRVYPDGYDSGYTVVNLESTTYDNKTVYKIPLYSPSRDLSGCTIDVVVFNPSRAIGSYYYEFEPGGTGKRWMAINANDVNNTIYFCDVGGWHQLRGGATINLVYIAPAILNPSQEDKTYFGRGIFWSGENELDWYNRKS
nr:MAG TPA: hypothetical protein [Caudoviricetes sp.]